MKDDHSHLNHSNNILHSNSDVNKNELTAPHDHDDLTDSNYRYNGSSNIYSTDFIGRQPSQSIDDMNIFRWNIRIETDSIDGHDNNINDNDDPMNQDYHLNYNNSNHSSKDAQLGIDCMIEGIMI
jgi:hypothetical protein